MTERENVLMMSAEHVDENIINRNEQYRPLDEYNYWQKVKTEIEKL